MMGLLLVLLPLFLGSFIVPPGWVVNSQDAESKTVELSNGLMRLLQSITFQMHPRKFLELVIH